MEQFLTTRIRRYYDLELPRSLDRRKRWPLMIALHGYWGDKESMMRIALRIAAGKMIVMSLQGPHHVYLNLDGYPDTHRIGFGWGTHWKLQEAVQLHHRDLNTLINVAVRKYRANPQEVFLLGFSQGAVYNYRYVFTYPRRVRGVITVCGGVPRDWEVNPLYKPSQTHVLHIAASDDMWYTKDIIDKFRRQLPERAASVDIRVYKSTHRFPRAAVPHIRRWIEQHR